MKAYAEIFLLVVAVIILIYIFFYFAQTSYSPSAPDSLMGSVCFSGNCFSVELATTRAQVERGLMYRKELYNDNGMLFIFDKEENYPFWMKNTLIPLDIIWIDGNGKIVFVADNVQPCKSLICSSVNPGVSAKYVLEINAGISEKIGLNLGEEVKIILN